MNLGKRTMDPSSTETSALSVLLRVIGEEKLLELSHALGGEAVYIPHNPLRDRRDGMIRDEFDTLLRAGTTCMSSYRQLAKRHSLSSRRIMEIINHAA